jgi:hypothetical protein
METALLNPSDFLLVVSAMHPNAVVAAGLASTSSDLRRR